MAGLVLVGPIPAVELSEQSVVTHRPESEDS